MDVFELLRRHEGVRLMVYCDRCGAPLVKSVNWWICKCPLHHQSPGNLSIGVGRNLDARGIDNSEATVLLADDVDVAVKHLVNFAWYELLDEVRQAALIDLCMNVGAAGFDKFGAMLLQFQAGKPAIAALELRQSLADHQEPRRIEELALMIETGQWPTGDY